MNKETIEEKLLEIQKEKSECLSYNTCPVCDSPEGHKTVESLIEELLQSQTQDIKKKLEAGKNNMVYEKGSNDYSKGYANGYESAKSKGNQALSDILEAVDKSS